MSRDRTQDGPSGRLSPQHPGRILVLTSSTGGGHDQRAYAFRDWVEQSFGASATVEVEHLLENASWLTHLGVGWYNWIQRRAPWMHNGYWWVVELFGLLQSGPGRGFNRYFTKRLLACRPTLVLSVHDSTNRGWLRQAREILHPQSPLCVTYCGEFGGGEGFSRLWVDRTVDRYYARTAEALEYAHRIGLPKPAGRVFQNFLRPEMIRPRPDREWQRSFRRRLGLDEDRLTLLLGSGAQGGGRAVDWLQALSPLAEAVQAIVVCGRDRGSQEAVAKWQAASEGRLRVHVEGFSQRMAELIPASDVVITRGGANLAAEACYFARPLLFSTAGGTMPQERLTIRYFTKTGAAATFGSPRQLTARVSAWLGDPCLLPGRQQAMERLRSPDSPADFVREIVDLSATPHA